MTVNLRRTIKYSSSMTKVAIKKEKVTQLKNKPNSKGRTNFVNFITHLTGQISNSNYTTCWIMENAIDSNNIKGFWIAPANIWLNI